VQKYVNTVLRELPRLLGVRSDGSKLPSISVVPLRLFLGATFIYAGLQKFTDPQFFSPTAPGFIGHQMNGFVRSGSPLSGVLTAIAIPHAAQFGALIAMCEIWVGLSCALGLLTRLGALGGLAISLTLYLTATWNVHPYFLGADLPYAVGWLTLALAGPDALTLDRLFFVPQATPVAEVPHGRPHPRSRSRNRARVRPHAALEEMPRKQALRGMGIAAGAIAGGGVLAAVAKLLTPNQSFASAASSLPAAPTSGATQAGVTLLGNVKSVPLNSAGQYTDPMSGDPALLVHLPSGKFVAYDAVCTHAGCTVEYDPTQQQLVCPCHGAAFDPARGAAVINGPAQQPLAALQVTIDAHGNAYARTNPGGSVPPVPSGNGGDGG
jgi:thiosulfate dehydrogenase [quinone] large subunit